MDFKTLIKKSWIYKGIYQPYRFRQEKAIDKHKHAIFEQFGAETLIHFAQCMQKSGLDYWLEFGTLLGAYRDNAFVPNELDLDIGANLCDVSQIHQVLIENGFRLVREFHVIGENYLEQTYEYRGVTLDMMYFTQQGDKMWCYGAFYDPWRCKIGRAFFHQVTAHYFRPFGITKIQFLGMDMCVPENTEEHLIEIFGKGYKVYDPNFKGDLNKIYYSWEEKKGIGFHYY